MRLTASFILIVSLLLFNAANVYSAPSDAGHVYFVEPDIPDNPDDNGQENAYPGTTADNRLTVKPNTDALRQVIITEQMARQIASYFPDAVNKGVYSIMGSENISINTEAREVSSEFISHLDETGEEIMLAFPGMTAGEPGIYVLGVAMKDIAEAGTLIDSVSTITPSGSSASFRPASDIEQITLLDQGGSLVTSKRATNGLTYAVVPDNQNMLIAVSLNAGETWVGSLTKPVQLPTILVEAVTIEQIAEIVQETDEQAQTETIAETTERITNNIIAVVQEMVARPEIIDQIITNNIIPQDILSRDVVSTDIKLFTSADTVADPEEPTPAMQEAVKDEGYEIAAKLNTVQVTESGFYLFKVTLSEESFRNLQGLTAQEVRVYALSDSEIEIMPSFITGILNTFELLTMSGEKMDTIGVREFLLIGLLNAGKPLSLYLAKLIVMLLLGGCCSGWSVAALSAVPAVITLTKFCRRQ